MAEDREGGDITASDMLLPDEEPSEMKNFYEGSAVFLTGATGFVGKMMLEKLLRAVDDIKIYILIRPKKGKDTKQRFEEIFESPLFDPLKRKRSDYAGKVEMILGDCGLPNLGICAEDTEKLCANVNTIIHCAATVRFDEKIKQAAHINVRSIRDLFVIAKQMKQLKALLYVSTAFSNCIRKDIDEIFYEPPITGEKLLTLVDCLDDEKLDLITPTLIGEFPNTYVFTKSVAENVVKEEGKNLPVGILRPSIIIGSAKEPVAGWIDNFYGATGVFYGAALGLIRTLHGKKENCAELVPADYVVNSVLAAAWDVATMKTLNDNKETQDKNDVDEKFQEEIPIYNFVCTPERPITWEKFEELNYKHAIQIPSEVCIWNYFFKMRPSLFWHTLALFFLHTLPAHIVDFIAICIGKKPQLVKGYQKINKFSNVISYFTMREWNFKNNNIQNLWKKMNTSDRKLFEFSMKDLSWDAYFYTYVRGARVYLLKDPLDTVSKGQIKYYKLKVAHYALCTVLFYLFYKLTMFIVNFIF
ncbi:unnamed protein product [Brassicogethes aeneus]|uniref:Fatty acyl-CoA reductase n=1 Tax=Brassicogethes aeneus TaxID=1431903 RepID=A0A9P0AUF0_BRAAE|nr:unnamed protein product [Brassicogethes aeneus]CAH0548732.1 unnamed protein product [Brassicogethes aeneus]